MGRKTYAVDRQAAARTRNDRADARPRIYRAGNTRRACSRRRLELAVRVRAREMGAREIIVAGGGELYRQTLPLAARLDVTEVDLSPAGDATFPRSIRTLWSRNLRVRRSQKAIRMMRRSPLWSTSAREKAARQVEKRGPVLKCVQDLERACGGWSAACDRRGRGGIHALEQSERRRRPLEPGNNPGPWGSGPSGGGGGGGGARRPTSRNCCAAARTG